MFGYHGLLQTTMFLINNNVHSTQIPKKQESAVLHFSVPERPAD